jgi:hypothetical protein
MELGQSTSRSSHFTQHTHSLPFPENFRGLSECHPLSWGNPRTVTGHMLRDVERLRTPSTMPPLNKCPPTRSMDDIRKVRGVCMFPVYYESYGTFS